jgi:c-di-GMP-binding flagellar brake protein YcgR
MTNAEVIAASDVGAVLSWARDRGVPITASVADRDYWRNLRSQLLAYDPAEESFRILYPLVMDGGAPPDIAAGAELGVSFRQGHKKIVFVGKVVGRATHLCAGGERVDALIVKAPRQIQRLQRRAYQRTIVPDDRRIIVKLWQAGPPDDGTTTWPLCTGRLANISLGGILLDAPRDQNPRLSVGDCAGVEIRPAPSRPPLIAVVQYRHCIAIGSDRIGLGLQFLGMEHHQSGRASLAEMAAFVKSLRMSDRPGYSN